MSERTICHRVHLNRDGYTARGEYFGVGEAPLWWVSRGDEGHYVRAGSRDAALLRAGIPSVRALIGRAHRAGVLTWSGDLAPLVRAAERKHSRFRRDPGDCGEFPLYLMCLAIAEAYSGPKCAGWIPRVQMLADTLEQLARAQIVR